MGGGAGSENGTGGAGSTISAKSGTISSNTSGTGSILGAGFGGGGGGNRNGAGGNGTTFSATIKAQKSTFGGGSKGGTPYSNGSSTADLTINGNLKNEIK